MKFLNTILPLEKEKTSAIGIHIRKNQLTPFEFQKKIFLFFLTQPALMFMPNAHQKLLKYQKKRKKNLVN